jgi:hypothetical protein
LPQSPRHPQQHNHYANSAVASTEAGCAFF